MAKHYIPATLDPTATLREIAQKYTISLSTASRWRKAVRHGDLEKIQQPIPITSRILGILWAIGYDTGTEFYLRCRYQEIVEEIKAYFGVANAITVGQSRHLVQYKLKMTGLARTAILHELYKYGWTPRNAEVRAYPSGDIDHKEFIRAWVQLHSYYYARKNNFRIYGNRNLIVTMNDIISRLTGVAPKTPQRLHNGKTYALYYQSIKEVNILLKYFSLKEAQND